MHTRTFIGTVAAAALALAFPSLVSAGIASGGIYFDDGYLLTGATISQVGTTFTYSGSLNTAFLTNQHLSFGAPGVPTAVPPAFNYGLSDGPASAAISAAIFPTSTRWQLSADVNVADATPSPFDFGRSDGAFDYVNSGIRISDVAPGAVLQITTLLTSTYAGTILLNPRHIVSGGALVSYEYTLVSLSDPTWSAPVFRGWSGYGHVLTAADLPLSGGYAWDEGSEFSYPWSATYNLESGNEYQLTAHVWGTAHAEEWPVEDSDLGMLPVLALAGVATLGIVARTNGPFARRAR